MTNKIREAQINSSDVRAIFKSAEELRDNQSALRRNVKFLQKDKITAQDLQSTWKEYGFPDDSDEIVEILKSHGYGDKEIKKVFSVVFGKSDSGEAEFANAPEEIKKLAELIKKRNLQDQVKEYMLRTYGEEIGAKENPGFFDQMKRRFTTEEVRAVFETIVHEDRSEKNNLIQKYRQENLGRQKK